MAAVAPIASGPDYRRRGAVATLRRVKAAGYVGRRGGGVAIRHLNDALTNGADRHLHLQELETAAAAIERGPLPPAALDRLMALWRQMGQERRESRGFRWIEGRTERVHRRRPSVISTPRPARKSGDRTIAERL